MESGKRGVETEGLVVWVRFRTSLDESFGSLRENSIVHPTVVRLSF